MYKNIVFERKTIDDLVHSVRSGHLQKQLLQMQDNFEYCFLIIVGDAAQFMLKTHMSKYRPWTLNHHLGLLSSILTRYSKIKIVQVPNDTQLVKIIPKICEKAYDGRTIDIGKTELMRDQFKDVKNVKVRMLLSISGMGYDRAVKLANTVDLVIINKDGVPITKKDIEAIVGFGKKTIESLLALNKDATLKTINKS